MNVSRRGVGKLALGAAVAATSLSGVSPVSAAPRATPAGPAFIDLRRYDGPTEVACDLCIAGAGAAGITLALTLARRGRRVVVLESGGFELEGSTQALYRGTTTGQPYFNLTSCRLRYFGGTTNHWGGVCNVPHRVDFEGRPALGLPAWPVGYDEIMPYVVEAARQLGLEPAHFEPAITPAMIEHKSELLRTQTNLQSQPPYRFFNQRYRGEVGTLPDTRVFLNANLTHIQMADNGSTVAGLLVKTLTGKTITVRPRITILACHAIENARLLLASNDVVTSGIGNAGDAVGRYFMDHINITAGRILPTSMAAFDHYYTDPIVPKARRKTWSLFTMRDEVLTQNDMLPYAASLMPRFDSRLEATGVGVSAMIKAFFQPFDMQVAADAGTLLGHPLSALASTAARFGLRERRPAFFEVKHFVAQLPDPNARVTLMAERDPLGVPMVSVRWSVSEAAIQTFARCQDLIADEVARQGVGVFERTPVTPDYVRQTVLGEWHHMGTTRMSNAAGAGVVDPDCRVHGTDNLYLAGSGLFPTTSRAAPTMLLMAFARRLADHLDREVLT